VTATYAEFLTVLAGHFSMQIPGQISLQINTENSHWRDNRQLRAEFRDSAPDAGKIPGALGMQNVLNGISMAVGVMEKTLYSSYTPCQQGEKFLSGCFLILSHILATENRSYIHKK